MSSLLILSVLTIARCKSDSGGGGGTGGDGSGGDAGNGSGVGGDGGQAAGSGDGGTNGGGQGGDAVAGQSGNGATAGVTPQGGTPGSGGVPSNLPVPDCVPPALKLTLVNDQATAAPMALVQPAGDANRYVVLRSGAVMLLGANNQFVATPFINISSSVNQNFGGSERGLLGLAFPADYAASGKFYLYYNRNSNDQYSSGMDGDLVVAEGTRATATTAMRATKAIATIPHHWNDYHVGGFFAFGADGMLYAGNGDAGRDGYAAWISMSQMTIAGPGQDPQNTLSKILRIDVKNPTMRPVGNMAGGHIHVWAMGVRNPFRGSFDRLTGDMYFGDVGEASWEEINYEPPGNGGRNYGWGMAEGERCFPWFIPFACQPVGTMPVLTYFHDGNGVMTDPTSYMQMGKACAGGTNADCSRAVIGGYVYRGTKIPKINGRYFYGDHVKNSISSFVVKDGKSTCPHQHAELGVGATRLQGITSFAEDAAGELYVMDLFSNIYKIDAAP